MPRDRWPVREERGTHGCPAAAPADPEPPADPDPPAARPARPGTYGEAAGGGALLRQGRVQGEAPARPVLAGEHHHGGLHGAGGGGGSAALCPPRRARCLYRPPPGWWKHDMGTPVSGWREPPAGGRPRSPLASAAGAGRDSAARGATPPPHAGSSPGQVPLGAAVPTRPGTAPGGSFALPSHLRLRRASRARPGRPVPPPRHRGTARQGSRPREQQAPEHGRELQELSFSTGELCRDSEKCFGAEIHLSPFKWADATAETMTWLQG